MPITSQEIERDHSVIKNPPEVFLIVVDLPDRIMMSMIFQCVFPI